MNTISFKLAIPVFHVASSQVAEDFYCQKLGFECRFAYRIDDSKADPCYMGFCRDNTWIHVSSFSGDAVPGGVAYLIVDDVDEVHAELVTKGVSTELEPTDQTWGNRETYVKDPDGNSIRFIQENHD